jgi:hypothetical protein
MGHRLIDVPVIEGGIGRHMDRELVKDDDGAQVQRTVIGDIGFMEGQGVLGDNDITVVRGSGSCHPGAVAKDGTL